MGAGFLRTFFQIVVPSASGSILTVSVLSLWNYTDVYYKQFAESEYITVGLPIITNFRAIFAGQSEMQPKNACSVAKSDQ